MPATSEIWIKFDVYWDGINFWRVFNANSGFNSTTPNGYLRIRANGSIVADVSTNPCAKNTLQTVLAHMRSGTTDGVIEAWVDGEKIYTCTGDVNHGQDFADIYLQSDGAGTFFSNVIISNVEIKLGEGWHKINFDVERVLIAPIYVPFIGEHFNHIIGSLNLTRGGKKKILLPKKSEVYIRAVGAGIIKIYSDTNAVGEITGVDYFTPNNLYTVNPVKPVLLRGRLSR